MNDEIDFVEDQGDVNELPSPDGNYVAESLIDIFLHRRFNSPDEMFDRILDSDNNSAIQDIYTMVGNPEAAADMVIGSTILRERLIEAFSKLHQIFVDKKHIFDFDLIE